MAFVVITTSYGLADISFKYDAEVVGIVKSIPSKVWDPNGKYWTIRSSHVPVLANMLVDRGHTVSVDGIRWMAPEPERPKSSGGNPFEDLMNGIPEKYRMATYKALTKVFHPDTGGDLDLMQKLNRVKP